MRTLKQLLNERGGALLTVFFILILFMILGLSISTFMVQGGKQRAFADDEIQGKMLADMGLTYFQKYLEEKMNETENPIKNGVKDSTNIDNFVQRKLDEVASDKEDGKEYILPGENQGGFKLGYKLENVINYKDNLQEPSQPYVRKITLYSLGLPPRAVNGSEQAKQVQLTSTVYINTIPAPFHYAVSTPGELRLFGGTNIIGNVNTKKVFISKQYRYRESSEDDSNDDTSWKRESDDNNKPYIEGTVYLDLDPNPDKDGKIISLPSINQKPGDSSEFKNEDGEEININRNKLLMSGVFSPKKLSDTEKSSKIDLSAPPKNPYIPGHEPPIIEKKTKDAMLLYFSSESPNASDEKKKTASEFMKEKMQHAGPATTKDFEVTDGESISFEQGASDGFRQVTVPPLSEEKKLVIRQTSSVDQQEAIPLTVRLTGKALESEVRQLYIGPLIDEKAPDEKKSAKKVTVEMGELESFKKGSAGEPFTFDGSIYIKGNLDIVGNINITGTIYVDGDVLIREIENVKDKDNKDGNLVIISSGEINLTARNEIRPLSAFLYSEQGLQVYSVHSFNWIYGGIATGNSGYLEFNTKRETTLDDNYLASHFTIQFNRKIFEEPTPGLPAGDTFLLDIYDIDYDSKNKLP